jgi:hypothetical protein
LVDEALSLLMGGQEHHDLDLVCVVTSLDVIDLTFVQGEGGSDMPATPYSEEAFSSVGSTSATPLTSIMDSGKAKCDAVSKTSSQASTPKPRSLLKRTLQDAFAEGSAKENEILDRLGTQKHERVLGELDLKHRKLEAKAMEKQHQRDCEREQHEFRMLQMRLMLTQNQQAAPMMQSQPQSSLGGLGFMAELADNTLPSGSSSSLASGTPFSL